MQFLQMLIFTSLALGILLGIHALLYVSLIRFFAISAPGAKALLAGTLIFLVVSFPFSTLFSHLRDNLFTRTFYFLSTFWLGLLVNLLMGACIVWLVILVAKHISFTPNIPILAGSVFLIALIYSSWGMWNALHPRIREISVTIQGLPAIWRGERIVQLSDVHLGHVFQHDFAREVVARVNELDPKVVLITGDLFDGMDGDLHTFVSALDALHPRDGTFFVTGNHETYLGVNTVFSLLEETKLTVLKDEVVDVDGVKIVGIDFPAQGAHKDIAKIMERLRPSYEGHPSIVLYHAPTNIDDFKRAGVDLQLSGHTHAGQLFPLRIFTWLIFHGYDYGLHTEGEYHIYTTNGVGSWGPTMRTGNTPEIVLITLQ